MKNKKIISQKKKTNKQKNKNNQPTNQPTKQTSKQTNKQTNKNYLSSKKQKNKQKTKQLKPNEKATNKKRKNKREYLFIPPCMEITLNHVSSAVKICPGFYNTLPLFVKIILRQKTKNIKDEQN